LLIRSAIESFEEMISHTLARMRLSDIARKPMPAAHQLSQQIDHPTFPFFLPPKNYNLNTAYLTNFLA
jgi:hypothetical protein